MLPEIEGPAMAAAAADKIRAALGEPEFVEGYEIRVTASIGTALYPVDGKSYEQLIQHADDAMYRAKAGSGRASIAAFPSLKPADPACGGIDSNNIRGIFPSGADQGAGRPPQTDFIPIVITPQAGEAAAFPQDFSSIPV